MRSKIKWFQILILVIATNVHGWDEIFRWTTINSLFLYDSKSSIFSQSFNVNSCFDIFNAGLSYGKIASDSDELALYLGLGIGHLIQIQEGFHGDGISIRNQYNIILGNLSYEFAKVHPYLALATISLNIEKFFYQRTNWVFGIGVGFSFNNMEGFNVFREKKR
jgi:hypothetical protein